MSSDDNTSKAKAFAMEWGPWVGHAVSCPVERGWACACGRIERAKRFVASLKALLDAREAEAIREIKDDCKAMHSADGAEIIRANRRVRELEAEVAARKERNAELYRRFTEKHNREILLENLLEQAGMAVEAVETNAPQGGKMQGRMRDLRRTIDAALSGSPAAAQKEP